MWVLLKDLTYSILREFKAEFLFCSPLAINDDSPKGLVYHHPIVLHTAGEMRASRCQGLFYSDKIFMLLANIGTLGVTFVQISREVASTPYICCSAVLSDSPRLAWLFSPPRPVLADHVSKHFHCVKPLQKNIRLPDFTFIFHLYSGYQAKDFPLLGRLFCQSTYQ